MLDLFFTNKPENIINSGVVHWGVSDHSLTCGGRKISLCKTSPKIVESRNFRHYKTLQFKRDLSIALSNCDCSADDPNALWKQFRDRFNEVSNLHAPIRLKKVKSKYTPWLNEEIIRLMNYRDTLKKKAVKTKSSRFHVTILSKLKDSKSSGQD